MGVDDTDDTVFVDTLPTDLPTDSARETDTDPEVDTDPIGPPPATFTYGAPVTCASPSAPAWTPWSPGGAWDDQDAAPTEPALFSGGGVAVADVDEDGVIDVFRTGDGGRFRWLALAPGGAVDRTDELPPMPERTSAVVVVDIDGDGRLDLHVTGWLAPDVVARQRPDGTFEDVAAAWGLAGDASEHTMAPSWADADGDGDLDAFVAAHGPLYAGTSPDLPYGDRSHLWIQDAPGVFHDGVDERSEVDDLRTAHTFQGAWVELDGTPGPELYVVNDFGWRTANGAWEVSGGAVVSLGPRGFEATGTNMGVGVGELGRDDLDDLLVPAYRVLAMYASGSVGWFETSGAVGVAFDDVAGQEVGWGAELADMDDDGDLDALIAFGFLDPLARFPSTPRVQPDGVWRRDGSRYTKVGAAWGLAQGGVGRGFVVVDLDGDGTLDVVKQDLAGPTTILTGTCGTGAWLEVDVRQPGANPFGIGTTVIVEDDGVRWRRTIRAGGTSYASAGPPVVHFGLGDRESVDRVEIHWPDGHVDTATGVASNRTVRVTR